jgi:predicted ATPase
VDTLPDSIRGLIISRIDQLSTAAQEVVRIAAVYDESFSTAMLQFVREQDEIATENLVKQLVEQQIFEVVDGDRYAFQHGVTQHAVYETLTRFQRQKLHLKIADYFNKQEGIEANILQKVHHTLKAGMLALAVELLTKAAQRAEDEQGDIEQAAELYSKALEIFPDDSNLQEQLARLQAQA